MQATLVEQRYFSLNKKQRGAVRALLSKVTGLSMPQITLPIRRYRQDGEIRVQGGPRRRFPVKYTMQDLELLIEVDRAHQRLSGLATRRILEREWQVFGKRQYARLSEISVAHLYNLRHSAGYRQRAAEFSKTMPTTIPVGERRRPDPHGAPGYLRVDTVHQGDWDAQKGVYHINAVDAVTQWEIVGCTAKISEQHLLPVLQAMPNLNAFAERWVRSAKQECLSRLILSGEDSLHRALIEFIAHYHSERNQGKGNALLFPAPLTKPPRRTGRCRQHLGGLLRYY